VRVDEKHAGGRRWRPLVWLAALLMCAGLVSACGSSDSDGGSTSSAATSSAGSDTGASASTTADSSTSADSTSTGKADADAFVKQMTVDEINIIEPIDGTIPSGVNVDWFTCTYPACTSLADHAADAAEVLGWKLNRVAADGTPSDNQEQAATLIQHKPDVVVIAGLDAATFRPQIKRMTDAGIKVVGFATTPVDGLAAMVRPPAWNMNYGKLGVSYAISQSDTADPTIGFVNTPAYFASRQNAIGAAAAIKEYCPECELKVLDLPPTSPGKDAPQKITNWLRGNSDISAVLLDVDAMALGLPPALKSAGLDDVPLYSMFPSEVSIPLLKAGQMQAVLSTNDGASSWATIDAVARLLAGVSTEQPTAADAVVWSVVDGDNVGAGLPQGPSGYEETFTKLWGK
jgi:ribose transport system substrate-binding protein